MPESRPEPTRIFLQRTWVRRTLLGLATTLLLLSAVILAVPLVVSSNWARTRVEQGLASATGKPATLRLLTFSWSDGLRAEGLRVGRGGLDDESFLCTLERLHAHIDFLSLLRRDLRLNAELNGLRLRKRLPPPAKPPVESPAIPLPLRLKDGLAALRQALSPAPGGGDAHLSVDLADIAVRLILPASGKALDQRPATPGMVVEHQVDLRDVTLRLRAPGLASGTASLDAGLKVALDGRELAPLTLQAKVTGLADAAGRLAPAQARLMAEAQAPGLHLTALGSVAKGFKTDLRLQLRELTALLKPFAGDSLPEASGSLALGLTLSQPDPDHLTLGLVAFADALRASGGPLGAKAVGPLKLNLLQEAAIDLAAGTIHLPGTLNLLELSSLGWQGEVTGLNQDTTTLSLNIRPLHLQLDELLAVARGWLPPGLGLRAGTLDAEGLWIQAALPVKPGPDAAKPQLEANATGLSLQAEGLTRASGPERLSLAKASLRLDSAQVVLPAAGAGRLEANAQAVLEGLRVQGKTPLTMKRVTLSSLRARIDGLAQDQLALFGLLGAASLEAGGEAQGLDAPGKAQVPALTYSLSLRADLPAAKTATVRLDSLALDLPLARVPRPGKRPVEAPVSLRLAAPDIRLGGTPVGLAKVSDARLSLDVGPALRCQATGSLDNGAVQSAGGLTLDVRKLLALAAPLLPPKAQGSGGVALDWKLSADLPQRQAPPAKPEKLSQRLARLGFLKELEAELKLSEVALDWPLAAQNGKPGETLRLRGLSTPKPLLARTSGGLRESSLSGSLAFGPLGELPGVGPLQKPVRGLLTLNLAQQGLRSVQVSEALRLDGLDTDQSLRLTLDRLDQVLDRDQDRLAAILELVDGTVGFDLMIGLKTGLQAMPGKSGKGISGKGRVEAGFDARLSGGRSLVLSARLLSPGLDLRLGPELAVSGLTSSLRLDKRYALSPGLRCAAPASEVRQPLSEQVFDLFPTASATGGNDFASTVLHGFQSGGGSLGFSQVKLKSGALPLSLRDVLLRLDTSGPLPALRSFRAGLLGGNILGSAMVKGASGGYSLEADLAFTGLDPSRLFPDKAAKDQGSQAETSGRVILSLPLTPDPEALLQRMALRADITKIGPRTLERMLYALDPDEQNETIVQQRRLMDMGYPRFVRLGLAYGNLSLSGEVEVKGFRLELPRIDRLPVGNLPLRKQLTKALAPVQALGTILDAASAGGICRDPAGPPGRLKVIGTTAQEGVAP